MARYALGLQLEDPPPPCTLPPTADIDGNDVDGNEVLRLERTSYAGGATGYVVSARYAADRAAEKEYNQQMNLKESERAKRAWAEKRKLRRLNLKGQQAVSERSPRSCRLSPREHRLLCPGASTSVDYIDHRSNDCSQRSLCVIRAVCPHMVRRWSA